jgi:Zn finger protein HypA/HybF involved in hydrogenase expression
MQAHVTITIDCSLDVLIRILQQIGPDQYQVIAPIKPNGTTHCKEKDPPQKISPVYSPRTCQICGNQFQPGGPRGMTCPDCKGKDPKLAKLDATLKEIEERNKKPYEFTK